MILFGLDIATLRWSSVDLVKDEIRLTTRRTDKVMILPIAPPLRRYLEGLPSSDNLNTPLHPRAFAVVARQGKSGALSRQFSYVTPVEQNENEKQKDTVSGLGITKEVGGIQVLLTHWLFASDILRRLLQRVSLAKPTSAPLRF
jgi:hypothetical protein